MSQLATKPRTTSVPQEADTAKHGAPPPLLFTAPLLTGLLLNRFLPVPLPGTPGVRLAGIILTTLGFALGVSAVREMGRFGNSPDPRVPVREVVSGGPYRFTRNPMYVSMSLMVAGLSLVARTFWPLFLLPSTLAQVTQLAIRPEEEYLERRFGDSYRRYKARVRRWI